MEETDALLELIKSGGIVSLILLFIFKEWPTLKQFFKSGYIKNEAEVARLVGEKVAQILTEQFIKAQERNRAELREQISVLVMSIREQNEAFNRFRTDFDRHCGYLEQRRWKNE